MKKDQKNTIEKIPLIRELFCDLLLFSDVVFSENVTEPAETTQGNAEKLLNLMANWGEIDLADWPLFQPIEFNEAYYSNALDAMLYHIQFAAQFLPKIFEKKKTPAARQREIIRIFRWLWGGEKITYSDFHRMCNKLIVQFDYERNLFCQTTKDKLDDPGKLSQKGEMSLPLGLSIWASIFGVGKNKMRELKDSGKYHFEQISERKWRLPKSELPAEYLEKYRSQLKP